MGQCTIERRSETSMVTCHVAATLLRRFPTDQIVGLHLIGVDAAVRAIVASIHMRRELVIRGGNIGYLWWIPRGEWWVQQGRTPGGYAEAWVLADLARETSIDRQTGKKSRLILAWDGRLEDQLYNLLDTEEDIPLRWEWRQYLIGRIKGFSPVEVWYTDPDHPAAGLKAAVLEWTSEEVEQAVRYGLQRRLISLPFSGTPGTMDGVTDLAGYVARFGKPLVERMLRDLAPLHRPGESPADPRLAELVRAPRGAQGDAIQGVSACLRHHRACFLVGETGSGKTLMGLGAIHLHAAGKPYRAYVQVPGHLLHKACREIVATVPGARVYVLDRTRGAGDDTDEGDLHGVRRITAAQLLREVRDGTRPRRPLGPEFYVVSRDRAKLGWFERHGAVWDRREHVWRCPDCGSVLVQKQGEKRGEQTVEAIPIPADGMREHRKNNHRCHQCGAMLWQADSRRTRRAAPAWILKKLGKWFDYAILDEIHELKGKDTAQGWTAGAAAGFSKKLVLQTGTLVGGYASHLWALLWRTVPYLMVREGFRWEDARSFVEQYGVLERVIRTEDAARYHRASRGTQARITVRERPGISPLLYTRVLLGVSVFVQLSDVADSLPPYTEEVELVEPDPELAQAYQQIENRFRSLLSGGEGARKFGGAYVNVAMAWPDRPWQQPDVLDPETGAVAIVLPDLNLPAGALWAKERRLIELVSRERQAGNRVLVYVQFTRERDVSARVQQVLQDAGFRAERLTASVQQEERERWLREAVRRGVEVVITHPRLVETGLDLLDFPALVFYEPGYNLFTLRQASRRSWRIGQNRPVRVVFLAYRGTIQETALALMGRKLEAALSLEGKWSDEGLAALAAGESLTAMLVRALKDGLEGVEAADVIWRRMYQNGKSEAEIATVAARAEPNVRILTLSELAKASGKPAGRKRAPAAERQLAFAF